MKKILFGIFATLYLAGCNLQFQNQQNQTTTTRTVEHPECSSQNPPRIERQENGYRILNICGDTSDIYSPIYEFPQEKIILFSQRNEIDSDKYTWSLRIISTAQPFQEEVLSLDFKGGISYFSGVNQYSDEEWRKEIVYFQRSTGSYVWTEIDEGLSSSVSVFAFQPDTRRFLSAYRAWSNFGPDQFILQTDNSYGKFFLYTQNCEINEGKLIGCKDLEENEIAFIKDEERISKKEFESARYAPYKKMMTCGFPYYIPEYKPSSVEEKEYKRSISEEYLKYFPEKIPCFKYKDGDYGEILGYFEANGYGRFDFSLLQLKQ